MRALEFERIKCTAYRRRSQGCADVGACASGSVGSARTYSHGYMINDIDVNIVMGEISLYQKPIPIVTGARILSRMGVCRICVSEYLGVYTRRDLRGLDIPLAKVKGTYQMRRVERLSRPVNI